MGSQEATFFLRVFGLLGGITYSWSKGVLRLVVNTVDSKTRALQPPTKLHIHAILHLSSLLVTSHSTCSETEIRPVHS